MQTAITTPTILRTLRVPSVLFPWLMWGIGILFAVLQFWTQLAMGHMGARIMADFSLDALGLSKLSASFFLVFVSMQIPSGLLLDRFGAAKVLSIAVLVLAFGCTLFANAQELWHAYAGRLLMGGGSAFAFVGMLTLAAGWFNTSKFVIIVAFSEMACLLLVSTGQFFLPVFIQQHGWRMVIQISAITSFVLFIVMVLIAHDGPYQLKAQTHSLWRGLKYNLACKTSWFNAGACGLLSVMLTVFIPLWGLPFLLRVHHLSYVESGWGVAIVVLGVAIGGPLFGWIANRLGKKKPVIVGCIFVELILFTILMLVYPMSKNTLYGLLFILGVFNSVYILSFSIAKEMAPAGTQGVSMAFTNMVCMSGSILIQPIVGFLLYLHEYEYILDGVPIYSANDYLYSFIVFPVSFGLALIFAAMLNEKHEHGECV